MSKYDLINGRLLIDRVIDSSNKGQIRCVYGDGIIEDVNYEVVDGIMVSEYVK